MRTLSDRLRFAWLVVSPLLLVLACARKAPGPSECQALARTVVSVRDERMLEVPRVKKAVDEVTVRCLVTPFDRELLRCVEARGPRKQCFIEFVRRAGPALELPPPE